MAHNNSHANKCSIEIRFKDDDVEIYDEPVHEFYGIGG
jgi:hypothetical protein